ncbi:MAG: hypothetical protein GY778_15565 [bacterium]|nr:hypothetical protein [bacterium]
MKGLRHRLELVCSLGLRWVLWRLGYAVRKMSGLLKRRFPAIDLQQVRLADVVKPGTPVEPTAYRAFREACAARFFFASGRLPGTELLERAVPDTQRARALAVADDFCRGRFLCYSYHALDLGQPVNWLINPFTGAPHHADTHWCDYPTFSSATGDIKDVWEPSRFACAYWLVRAYALSGDDKYAETFWRFFESWCGQNPPNLGPNWKCGQETALRSMAWCFGLYGFWNASATTPQRVCAMVAMLAVQADRIAGNIGYAVSQKNNHGLSEAIGLLTTAWMFPELAGSQRWETLGRKVLEREVRRQIYDDGSYVQHSMNYHRVMLHDCLWAIRLAELNDRPLSNELIDRVARAGQFLLQMLDAESGGVPNYGANDGALVLPLSSCDYRDYRPTVQAAGYQRTGRPVLPAGPWDEMSIWLYGTAEPDSDPAEAAAARRRVAAPLESQRFDAGGYYTLRSTDSWCMVRCHRYRDRPAHVDLLHLDLWYRGVNVLGDSGTYKYYAPDEPDLDRYFSDLAAHNTVEVDGRGPLDRFSRFLWLPWPVGECTEHRSDRWSGLHYAYDRAPWNVVHRRTVRLCGPDAWEVIDEVAGSGERSLKLRWHLADGETTLLESGGGLRLDLPVGPVTLTVEGPPGLRLEVQRGLRSADGAAGWRSDYYGQCGPRPTLVASVQGALPIRLVTRIELPGEPNR